jgi:hypothetical protein
MYTLFFAIMACQLLTTVMAVNVVEYFNITELNTHFMGPNSGLPGGQWPPGSDFPSTINFTIYHYFVATTSINGSAVEINSIPPAGNVYCAMNWTTPVFDWQECAAHDPGQDGFCFRFKPQDGLSGANFTLEIVRTGLL